MNKCPICRHNYKALSESENVCLRHEIWLVTRCVDCGVFSFSDTAGFCMVHAQLNDFMFALPKGSPDKHRYLRSIGQEGQPLRGF